MRLPLGQLSYGRIECLLDDLRLIDVLAAASRAGSGLDVVAYASDLDSAHPLVDSTIARLVGAYLSQKQEKQGA